MAKDFYQREWDRRQAAHEARTKRTFLVMTAIFFLLLLLWPVALYGGAWVVSAAWHRGQGLSQGVRN